MTTDETSGCSPEMIICDSGGEIIWQDDGCEETYAYAVDGASEDLMAAGLSSICPSYVAGTASVTLSVPTPDGTTRSVRIMSTGIWT